MRWWNGRGDRGGNNGGWGEEGWGGVGRGGYEDIKDEVVVVEEKIGEDEGEVMMVEEEAVEVAEK